MLMYECDPLVPFNDTNLPNDVCDRIKGQIKFCLTNIASAWAVGGDGVSSMYTVNQSHVRMSVRIDIGVSKRGWISLWWRF